MSYYVEQDDLSTVRQWFENNRELKERRSC
jgi:hypothetical protein